MTNTGTGPIKIQWNGKLHESDGSWKISEKDDQLANSRRAKKRHNDKDESTESRLLVARRSRPYDEKE